MTTMISLKLVLLLVSVFRLSAGITATCEEDLSCDLQTSYSGNEKNKKSSPETTVCLQDNNYDPCIDSSSIEGYCNCDPTTRTISVYRGATTSQKDDYYLRYCLDQFAAQGYFRYSGLKVVDFENMALEGDIMGDMKFDKVEFSNSNISTVSSNFLASSTDVTSVLIMEYILSDQMPSIEANCLEELQLKFQSTQLTKIRESNFQNLLQLRELTLSSDKPLYIGRNAFREQVQLVNMTLRQSVELTFGSLSFRPNSKLKQISILQLDKATPGSAGVLPGLHIAVFANYQTWSPLVWFNHMAVGGTLYSFTPIMDCISCQLAWMKRGFAAAVNIRCFDELSGTVVFFNTLTSDYFEHCP